MKKLTKIILAISLLLSLSACFRSNPENAFTFHLAQTRVTGLERNIEDVKLPLSGMSCKMDNQHFMSSNELQDVDVADVTLDSGEKIAGFYFTTTLIGKNRLLSSTAGNQGAFIILRESNSDSVNNIVGARQIDMAINNGKIFIIPEIEFESDEEIEELVKKWKESIRRHRAIRDSLY